MRVAPHAERIGHADLPRAGEGERGPAHALRIGRAGELEPVLAALLRGLEARAGDRLAVHAQRERERARERAHLEVVRERLAVLELERAELEPVVEVVGADHAALRELRLAR